MTLRWISLVPLTDDHQRRIPVGQPLEHGLRTALLAVRVAEAMGLSEDDQAAVF